MQPLSVRLAPSRFMDPTLLCLVALAVALFFAFRGQTPATRRARWARIAAWGAWGAFWVISLPVTNVVLTRWTETRGPDLGVALAGQDLDKTALVVLAAGMRSYDPEVPPRERLDPASTQRVLTASRLWHDHPFGIVVLSGTPRAETEGMTDLITTLGVPRDRLVGESRSRNTRENAAYSAEILRQRGVTTVVVVTSAVHLRRSIKDFEAVGVHAIPAAAEIVGHTIWGVDALLPSSTALAHTHSVLHEIVGYLRG
jgi:uncharacterized SAM-binding protein YcdF (DUF218 family)